MQSTLLKKISIGFAILVLIAQMGLQLHLAKTDAQTTDEAIHLYAGYTNLTRGSFSFSSEHPPLVRMIAAFPLLFLHPNEPATDYWQKAENYFFHGLNDHRDLSETFLYGSGNNADQLLFWGRVPIVFLTLLLGFVIYLISVRLWGWGGGMIAVALYGFDPTITAHGHLITTDIGVALLFVAGLWSFWRYIASPTWKKACLLGVVLGLALLTKFTAVLLLPICGVIFIWWLITQKDTHQQWRSYTSQLVMSLLIAWAVVLVGYRGDLRLPPRTSSVVTAITASNVLTEEMKTPDAPATALYNTFRPFLIPRDYVKGLVFMVGHIDYGHESFLLGQRSYTGWWYYFPTILSAKLPIWTLCILGLSLLLIFYRKKNPIEVVFLLGAVVIYLIIASFSRANIGVRHLLPIFPLLFILGGAFVLVKQRLLRYGAATLLVGLLLLGWVGTYPHYLSYFNQLYGGTNNGYTVATDSNLDWGQDLKRIKRYIDQHQIKNPYIEYYWDGLSSLSYYGIESRYLADFKPGDTGYVIIGGSALQSGNFDWLKNHEPIDRITPSVFVYKIT